MNIIKSWRKVILLSVDIGLINLAYFIAYALRFDNKYVRGAFSGYLNVIVFILFIFLISFYFFKLYDSLWIYASIDEFLLAVSSCLIAGTIILALYSFIWHNIPASVNIMAAILTTILVVGFRLCFRIHKRATKMVQFRENKNRNRVMIIGAGSAGSIVLKEIFSSKELRDKPVCIIDDSRYKIGTSISGVKVMGTRKDIKRLVNELRIDVIIIAIPTLTVASKKELINICRDTGCEVKIMPGIYELINGNVSISKIRNVEVEDLLGREPIKLSHNEIDNYIKGKIVLVTGGGGSIGSELSRQIARFNPKKLIILDIYENNAYDIQMELKSDYKDLNLEVIIASVRDKKRLESIFREKSIDVVFHAAAHKHVPLMENNPEEAIKNNIFGTLNVAQMADKYNIKRFVMISTDKAVNPTNIMGATKRTCEMIIQAMDKRSSTEFVAVRFGNVLGSNGSVIPLFKKQIAKGGPVTVTHKEITRYFMTIPEAAQLVLQAGAYAKGGEIFVLDMGSPVKIYDLACDLIRLSGFEPNRDIKIKVTGLRPGEKLYEELLMAEEGLESTEHEKIFVGKPTFSDMKILNSHFKTLKYLIECGDREEIISEMMKLVPTYRKPNTDEDTVRAEAEVASSIAN